MRKFVLLVTAAACLCAPALARAASITVTSTGFSPATITVNQNDTIVWTNTDPAAAKAAATSLTIAPASLAVVYGGTTALSGTVAGNQAGVKVDIMAEPWGEKTFHKPATVTTGAGGKWSYAAKPSIRTAYRATVGNASSA